MAIANGKKKQLFIESHITFSWGQLIDWIVELLPQEQFDGYIKQIIEEMNDDPH